MGKGREGKGERRRGKGRERGREGFPLSNTSILEVTERHAAF